MIKNLLFVCICLTGIFPLWGQNITVIEQSEVFSVSEKQEEFNYIEKESPLPNDRWLATLEGFCTNTKKSNLGSLFYDFWEMANTMGANAFFVEGFLNTADTIFVTISIFNLTKRELIYNYRLYSCNKIYVFGDLVASKKTRKFKINEKKVEVYPMHYYEYQSAIGENVKVNIGGFSGSTYVRTGEGGRVSAYLLLGGGTAKPAVAYGSGVVVGSPPGTGVSAGVRFTTGSIYPLDINFGLFLAEILELQITP